MLFAVLALLVATPLVIWNLYIFTKAVCNDPWPIIKMMAVTLIIVSVVFIYNFVADLFSDLFDDSPTVYITRTGDKYHRYECMYLSESCREISLRKAKRKGYAPCSVCY